MLKWLHASQNGQHLPHKMAKFKTAFIDVDMLVLMV